MKKFRKFILILLIISVTGTTVFGRFGRRGSGLGKLVGLVSQIAANQVIMKTELGQQGMKMVTQINNQVRQIENQLAILKGLSQEIASGNLTNIDAFYREMNNMLDSYKSIMLDTSRISSDYLKIYDKNRETFEKAGISEETIREVNQNMIEARNQSNLALYDVMTQKGFAAKIGADEQNLKMLLNASKSSTGVVEALQVTNSLLGQISSNISQLGLLVETASKAQAMSTNTESQELQQSREQLIEYISRQKLNEDKKMQEMKSKARKSISL